MKCRTMGKVFLCLKPGKSSFSKRETGSKATSSSKNMSSFKNSNVKRSQLQARSRAKTIASIFSKKRASDAFGSLNSSPKIQKRRAGLSSKRNRNRPSNRKPKRSVSSNGSVKKQSFSEFVHGKTSTPSPGQNKRDTGSDRKIKRIRRRRKRKTRMKENVELDEASRLQRRMKYLLIKMKMEQTLIDAYLGEGWKGQSREKIKPEKELQRAEKQILKCKLGIRDAIRQLDLLSSEGCIEGSVIDADGSVFHEHIFCAKCKLRDAFPDNDIILCDGACNCAFHQKCLEPPLATENIPPGDQGWLCKFCEYKTEILEAINAHLGTRFSVNNSWEDIFKDAATVRDGKNTSLDPEKEWPSEDSEDDDYDPLRNEKSCSGTGVEESMSDDSSNSSGFFWSSDEASSQSRERNKSLNTGEHIDSAISIDSDNGDDRVFIFHRRRQRRDVDYKKLHDEMFGKEFSENEHSEDEDWGPGRRKRRRKESEVGTFVSSCGGGDGCSNKEANRVSDKKLPFSARDKRPIFRIPPNAVEKLRCVFAENELPSRDIKENLSKQLGLASEKVHKWFKNARYTALKIRKGEIMKRFHGRSISKGSNVKSGKNKGSNQASTKLNSHLVPFALGVRIPKSLRRARRRKNPKSSSVPFKGQHKRVTGTLPSNIIERLRAALMENQFPSMSLMLNLAKQLDLPYQQVDLWYKSAVCSKKKQTGEPDKKPDSLGTKFCGSASKIAGDKEQACLVELERLFGLESRVEKLKRKLRVVLHTFEDNNNVISESNLDEQLVIYVPVAEVREKV